MKKIIFALLAPVLCLTLLLSGNADTFVCALEKGELPVMWLFEVPDRISMTDVNAIPVATPEMSVEEWRQICVDFMRLQQTFTWTPAQDLDYLCTSATTADENGLLHYKAGTIYAGLPYGGGSATLYSAMDYYDPVTGVWDVSALVSGTSFPLTNDCGTAVVWSLARVCTSLKKVGTVNMTQKNGYLPVGQFTYDPTIERFDASEETLTKAICNTNGEQVMFESYALLQKADGIVRRNASNGHARMVVEDAVVVRNADGSIDGANSYIITFEQSSGKSKRTVDNQEIIQNGWINKQYKFSTLFKDGYLPFTIAEFTGAKEVERAQVSLDRTGSGLSLAALRSASVSTNYIIAKVTLTVTGSDGVVKEKITNNVKASKLYSSYKLSNLIPAAFTPSGHVLITATVGSGETLTVYEGDACYDESGVFQSAHDYNAVVTEPTAVQGGYTTYTCVRCGDSYVADETEATGTVWGDANGDGKVSNIDIVRLKNYLANFDDETGISTNGTTVYELFPGADANGDDRISNTDIVRLKNYLANYDDETGTSSVKLGP